MRQALLRQRERGLPFDLIFPNRLGKPRSMSNVRTHWRHIRGDDYAWVTPHSFRRTVATVVERAYGTEHAAKRLGHSDPDVTRKHFVDRTLVVPAGSKPARHLRPINDT
ncbi:tyrosine-type recombinase/integrase [Mycolicibacter arupensis]|uniref:tyrosine-type recombinase/integrase n=1 Tax=Mycolicibacter arupensis TaxID=342002 RepID=UPI003B3B5608